MFLVSLFDGTLNLCELRLPAAVIYAPANNGQ
mgnify:CR=1 FL=1